MSKAQVPIAALSTVELIKRVLVAVKEHARKTRGYTIDAGTLPFGCVVCGDGSHLQTHEVKGYGSICTGHKRTYPNAEPYPWADEAAELTRRGLILPED